MTRAQTRQFPQITAGMSTTPAQAQAVQWLPTLLWQHAAHARIAAARAAQGPTSDGWACNGAIREYRDYHCTGTGASETYTPSQQEDCAAKSSTDSDGSPAAYTTGGTVTDYTGCSSGNCAASTYADSCSGTVLTEYGASGASYTSGNYNCESYETAFCSNGKQYRNEWSCGSSPGQCYDTGTDTQIGTDTDGDGVDQQCEDTAACDRNAATAGICNTAVSGKCVAKTASEALCSDGKDNDCDGLADCSDPDCAGSLSGSIKNSNGEALTNADNNAKAEAYQGAIRANTYSSDASGNYNPSKTRDVLCGTYNVVASAEQYVSKSVPSVQVPPQTDVIVQFTGSNALAQGTQCEADCTYAGDNTLHQECNNVNGCSFYSPQAAVVCNLAQEGWERIYSETQTITCPSGPPQEKLTTQASVSCSEENLVKLTKIVIYKGEPVKMVVTVCG